MAETESDIKRETVVIRLKVTFFLLTICFVLLCILCVSDFNAHHIILSYLIGLISAFFGLTYRSVLFLGFVDRLNGKILPIEKQFQNVYEGYLLKYIPLILLFSIISVSLIQLIFVQNEELTLFPLVLILAINIVIGLRVEYLSILR